MESAKVTKLLFVGEKHYNKLRSIKNSNNLQAKSISKYNQFSTEGARKVTLSKPTSKLLEILNGSNKQFQHKNNFKYQNSSHNSNNTN
jgi:hypothetical protein